MNMDYCKYRNTLIALRELEELENWDTDAIKELSTEEYNAFKNIVRFCFKVKENYDYNNIEGIEIWNKI